MENPILSGTFISTGTNTTFSLRTPVDWMWVKNYTAIGAQIDGVRATEFYWQLGMPRGGGIVHSMQGVAANQALTSNVLTNTGFFQVDSSYNTPGAPVAINNSAASAQIAPVFLTATTPNIGDIVRFYNMTGNRTLGGIDYTVTAVTVGVSFTIGTISTAGAAAVTAGQYRRIPNENVFYPRQRTISYMVPSGTGTTPFGFTRIYTTVTHGYVPGQKVRLFFPGLAAVWGAWAAFDGVLCTIVAVNTASQGNEPTTSNNFDVDLNSATFAAWILGGPSWLVDAQYPQAFANVNPVGENVAFALGNGAAPVGIWNQFAGSQNNVAILGMTLGGGNLTPAGNAGPAGALGDVMYWVAGTSFDDMVIPYNALTPVI